MKKPLILPKFKNEDEERDFWSNINLADYYEPSDAQPVSFPNLKPTSRSISIRLPAFLLNRIKEKANEINIPYQSLIKTALQQIFFGDQSYLSVKNSSRKKLTLADSSRSASK